MANFKLSQEDVLIELIKEANPGKLLNETMVTFSDPVVHIPTPDIPRNTSIEMEVSNTETPYRGKRTFYYNRVNINDFKFEGLITEDDLVLNPGASVRSDDLFNQLSYLFDIRIDKNMIVSEPIPVVLNTPVPFTVKFNPKNITIIGDLQIQLKR